jgi:hypothetical protein
MCTTFTSPNGRQISIHKLYTLYQTMPENIYPFLFQIPTLLDQFFPKIPKLRTEFLYL